MDILTDPRNVIDFYKDKSNEEIMVDLEMEKSNFGVLLVNTEHDLNISNIVRSANAFGAKEVVLYGKRHFDRRGCVGCYKYLKIHNVKDINEFCPIVENYDIIIGIDNNVPYTVEIFPLNNYVFYTELKYLFIFGSEKIDIPQEIGQICDCFVEIPQVGSIRSINLATAAGIVMFEFLRQMKEEK